MIKKKLPERDRERCKERGRVHTCGMYNRTIASLAKLPVILMYGGPAVRTGGWWWWGWLRGGEGGGSKTKQNIKKKRITPVGATP